MYNVGSIKLQKYYIKTEQFIVYFFVITDKIIIIELQT